MHEMEPEPRPAPRTGHDVRPVAQGRRVRRKLSVGAASDPLELEADRLFVAVVGELAKPSAVTTRSQHAAPTNGSDLALAPGRRPASLPAGTLRGRRSIIGSKRRFRLRPLRPGGVRTRQPERARSRGGYNGRRPQRRQGVLRRQTTTR
jgi:hypothetical protein